MSPDIEALLRAYDEYLEARTGERESLRKTYDSMLNEVAQRQAISVPALHQAVKFQYIRWVKTQKHPPTLPPSA
jgi:hypothetical protein